MTQAQNETAVIIYYLDFRVYNFLDETDNKRKDFYIQVVANNMFSYSKHPNDYDRYDIEIYEVEDYNDIYEFISVENFERSHKFISKLTSDSRGNNCNHDTLTGIEEEVVNILFHKKHKGIFIQQDIDCSSDTKVEVMGVHLALCNYPIKKGMVANFKLATYALKEPNNRNDWYSVKIKDLCEEYDTVAKVLNSSSTLADLKRYPVARGKRTKLYKEVIKILREDEVQGIIRPF